MSCSYDINSGKNVLIFAGARGSGKLLFEQFINSYKSVLELSKLSALLEEANAAYIRFGGRSNREKYIALYLLQKGVKVGDAE